MNHRLSLHNTVSPISTPMPSNAEMARRLELFELGKRDKKIDDLTARIYQLEGDHQREVDQLRAAHDQKLQAQRNKFALALEAVEVNSTRDDEKQRQLQHYTEQLAAAGDQLAEDKDRLQAEVDALQAQLKTTLRLADTAQQAQRELEAEVKQLRALNPERLAKQVKETQKANKEKTAALAELRKQCRQLKKDNEEKARVIIKLDDAVNKSVEMINSDLKRTPLETFDLGPAGVWEIYANEVMNRYEVTDTQHRNTIGVDVVDGELTIEAVRSVPNQVLQHILWRADGNVKNEAILAAVKKPLKSKEA